MELTLAHEEAYHPRKQRWREKDVASFRQGLGALLADLLINASNETAQGLMYRSTARSGFSGTYCSSRHYGYLVTLWTEMRLIEHFKGFQKNGDFEGVRVREYGMAGRLRATPRLLGIAEEKGIDPDSASKHFPKDHFKSQPIQVKSRRGSDYRGKRAQVIRPPRSPKLDRLNAEIAGLNAFLEGFEFNISTPQFRRTFNNGDDPNFDYDQGGRLYCVSEENYQSWRRSERVGVTINGEPCSEVDVSSSFLLVFHWLCGEPFNGSKDLYLVPGIERMVVKKLIVSRFGADRWPTQWPRGFKVEYFEETGGELTTRYRLGKVCEAIQSTLPILDKIDQKINGWAQLQYWESHAIVAAILELKAAGIPSLPIHDSLLVPHSQIEAACRALEDSYSKTFGTQPGLKVHPALD